MKKMNLENFSLDGFSQAASFETDRSYAVLAASLVDAKLEELFYNRLQTFQTELISNLGPLSTFSARIKLANSLGWIGSIVRSDLDRIRSIRNDFAHSFDHGLSFETDSISDRCKSLKTAEAFLAGYDVAINNPQRRKNLSHEAVEAMKQAFVSPRSRYQVTIEFISQYFDEIAENEDYTDSDFLSEITELSSTVNVQITGNISVENKPNSVKAYDKSD